MNMPNIQNHGKSYARLVPVDVVAQGMPHQLSSTIRRRKSRGRVGRRPCLSRLRHTPPWTMWPSTLQHDAQSTLVHVVVLEEEVQSQSVNSPLPTGRGCILDWGRLESAELCVDGVRFRPRSMTMLGRQEEVHLQRWRRQLWYLNLLQRSL